MNPFYVAVAKLVESTTVGIAAAGLSILLLIGLWYAYPWLLRKERRRAHDKDEAAEPIASAAR